MVVAVLGGVVSCSDESTQLQQEAADVAEDAITDYYFEDADDMAGLAIISDSGTDDGGRVASGARNVNVNDQRFTCATVTITLDEDSTPNTPKGEIVIDFGNGCTDVIGNERKGKIHVRFTGRRFCANTTVVTTFENYSVNGIKLSGTRTLTVLTPCANINSAKFRIRLENGKAIWPDGTEATRAHCLEREWKRNQNNLLLDELVITQCADENITASGNNRRGRAYTMSIVEPVIYKRGCPIAVSGIKQFTDVATNKVITVNYGDGSCDRVITITVDGNSRNVNVNKRG